MNKKQVEEKLGRLSKKFNHYKDKAVRYTEKNPKKALAIASAAGILIGAFLNSFGKKKKPVAHRAVVKRTTHLKG